MSNQRCQSCHKVKFASLAAGHPAFRDYPYTRRPRLAFDHHRHFRKNFSEAKTAKAPESCAACHLPDSSGRFMLVQAFEQTCAACHRTDIEGEPVAGPKGIAVFSVPGLDREIVDVTVLSAPDPQGFENRAFLREPARFARDQPLCLGDIRQSQGSHCFHPPSQSLRLSGGQLGEDAVHQAGARPREC